MSQEAWRREAVDRTGWLEPDAAPGLRLTQLTSAPVLASSHIYPEARIFTPDGRRFVFERFPEIRPEYFWGMPRRYWVCDLESGGAIRPLTQNPLATGPSVSPDGDWLYYLVDTGRPGAGRVELHRVDLDGALDVTLAVVDAPIPGSAGRTASRLYPLSTISSDGKRLATGAFLGDGGSPGGPWGVLRFDLETMEAAIVWGGSDYCNPHPQGFRGTDPAHRYDLLVQHNHGCVYSREGHLERLTGGAGGDFHVVTEDGASRGDFAAGRDGAEFSQGHQAWRGEQNRVVARTRNTVEGAARLLDLPPCPHSPNALHAGRLTPGAERVELGDGRHIHGACHFGLDPSGTRLVWDNPREAYGRDPGDPVETVWLQIGTLVDDSPLPLRAPRLLRQRSSYGREQYTHPHPFLSPDAARVFFNSDRTGVPQTWMVEGFEFPAP
ncbi:MAG: PD40 domain-containing protein [Actinobacteria bacterium]|nr:PD40 domain-containing protein [Actinomycetota bacterium]